MVTILPTYKGYVVDKRVRQFRKVDWSNPFKPSIEFVDFKSPKGKKLLKGLKRRGYDKVKQVV